MKDPRISFEFSGAVCMYVCVCVCVCVCGVCVWFVGVWGGGSNRATIYLWWFEFLHSLCIISNKNKIIWVSTFKINDALGLHCK